jgi:hypothetical protein
LNWYNILKFSNTTYYYRDSCVYLRENLLNKGPQWWTSNSFLKFWFKVPKIMKMYNSALLTKITSQNYFRLKGVYIYKIYYIFLNERAASTLMIFLDRDSILLTIFLMVGGSWKITWPKLTCFVSTTPKVDFGQVIIQRLLSHLTKFVFRKICFPTTIIIYSFVLVILHLVNPNLIIRVYHQELTPNSNEMIV